MTSCRRGTARGVRALAVVAVLLCGFATLAPLLGQVGTTHPQRIHVVKVVNAASADQHSSTLRLDHPAAIVEPGSTGAGQLSTGFAAAGLHTLDDPSVDSARTRGPPTAAV